MVDLETLAFESSLDMENGDLVQVKKEEPEADWMEQHFLRGQEGRLHVNTEPYSNAQPHPEYHPLEFPPDVKPIIPSVSLFAESYHLPPPSGDEVVSCSLPVHIFQSMLDSVICSSCKQRQVKVKYEVGGRYAHDFVIYCQSCGDTLFV